MAHRHGGRAGELVVGIGTTLTHLPALPVPVVGTAGAGDAHLAGIIAGLAAGLPLREAHQLGVLTAAVAVQSPHTINFELDREALWVCAGDRYAAGRYGADASCAGSNHQCWVAVLLIDSINPADSLLLTARHIDNELTGFTESTAQ